jgi:hypothetical protein
LAPTSDGSAPSTGWPAPDAMNRNQNLFSALLHLNFKAKLKNFNVEVHIKI